MASSVIFIAPPGGSQGSRVLWLWSTAHYEQGVMLYVKRGQSWSLVATRAKPRESRWRSASIPPSTQYETYLMWLLHKEGPPDPNKPWRNSVLTRAAFGAGPSAIPSGHPQYRTKAFGASGYDRGPGPGPNVGAFFAYDSPLPAGGVEVVGATMPDGWVIAPPSLSLDYHKAESGGVDVDGSAGNDADPGADAAPDLGERVVELDLLEGGKVLYPPLP